MDEGVAPISEEREDGAEGSAAFGAGGQREEKSEEGWRGGGEGGVDEGVAPIREERENGAEGGAA